VRDRRFLKTADDGRLGAIRAELSALRARLDEAVTEAVRGDLSAATLGKVERTVLAQMEALQAESRRIVLPASGPPRAQARND
jgi:hypothetical protein